MFFGDADAGVANGEANLGAIAARLGRVDVDDDLARGRELQRVVEQIEEDLFQSRRIAAQSARDIRRGVEEDLDIFLAGADADDVGDVGEQIVEIEVDARDLDASRFDA